MACTHTHTNQVDIKRYVHETAAAVNSDNMRENQVIRVVCDINKKN